MEAVAVLCPEGPTTQVLELDRNRKAMACKVESALSTNIRKWFGHELVTFFGYDATESQMSVKLEQSGSGEGVSLANNKHCVMFLDVTTRFADERC